MAYLSIKTPAPKTNRRKCGWGSVTTNCTVCGKIMVGHNRGVCSRCMRSLGGDCGPQERVLFARHIGYHAFMRDLANCARVLAFAGSATATAKRNAKTAVVKAMPRKEVK